MPAGLGEVVQAKEAFPMGSNVSVSAVFVRGRAAPVTVPAALPAFAENPGQVAAAFLCCRLFRLVWLCLAASAKLDQEKQAIMARKEKSRQTKRAITPNMGKGTPESGILLPDSFLPLPKEVHE